MITAAPEAVLLHERQVDAMWRKALKGTEAVRYLRQLIATVGAPTQGEAQDQPAIPFQAGRKLA
jgi:hypothetical protein